MNAINLRCLQKNCLLCCAFYVQLMSRTEITVLKVASISMTIVERMSFKKNCISYDLLSFCFFEKLSL